MTFVTKTPVDVKPLLETDEGWVYIDVRTEEEFELGHVPGAFNIPVMLRQGPGMTPNPEFASVVQSRFEATTKIVFGCAMGGRSQRACELMGAEGYGELINMFGGFQGARDPTGQVLQEGWQELGYPVENGPDAERGYAATKGS